MTQSEDFQLPLLIRKLKSLKNRKEREGERKRKDKERQIARLEHLRE